MFLPKPKPEYTQNHHSGWVHFSFIDDSLPEQACGRVNCAYILAKYKSRNRYIKIDLLKYHRIIIELHIGFLKTCQAFSAKKILKIAHTAHFPRQPPADAFAAMRHCYQYSNQPALP